MLVGNCNCFIDTFLFFVYFGAADPSTGKKREANNNITLACKIEKMSAHHILHNMIYSYVFWSTKLKYRTFDILEFRHF